MANGWANYIDITVDHTEITELLTDHPVPLILSTSAGISAKDLTALFTELGANRLKLAVVTSDYVTECYVESSYWDNNNNKGVLYTKAPEVQSDVDTKFRLYYDKNHDDNTAYVGLTNSSNAESVWDSNYKAVYHMSDGASNAAIYDSTSNNNDGAKKGANEPIQVAGDVGYAQDFDGIDDIVNLGNNLKFGTGNFTVEVMYNTSTQALSQFVGYGDRFDSAGWTALLTVDGYARMSVDDGATQVTIVDAVDHIDGATHLYSASMDKSGNGVVYIDGSSVATEDISAIGDTDTVDHDDVILGSYWYLSSWQDYYDGLMDEVRISSTARTAGWIAATNSGLRDTLVTFGTPTKIPSIPLTVYLAKRALTVKLNARDLITKLYNRDKSVYLKVK